MARAARAAGRAARQLRLRRRGAAPRGDSAAAQLARRRHDVVLAARADWLVCKEVCIPEGADLTLVAAGGRNRARPIRAGAPPSPRRARRFPRRSQVGSASAAGSGTTIKLTLVPPPGRCRSRRDSLLPVRAGQDRSLGAAARHARRRCVCADAAGRADARGPARSHRRRRDGRRRIRRGARGDDRRRRRRQRRAPGRRRRRRPRPRSISLPLEARDGDAVTLAHRRRVGARRRLDPQSHALRLPGADAEGAGLRDAPGHATDDAARSRRVRGRRRADVRRAGCGARRPARRRRAARLGIPAAVARRSSARSRSCSSCWRSTCPACSSSDSWRRPASPTGRRRIARSTRSAPASSPSSSRRRAPRRSWAPRSASRWPRPAATMLAIFVALGIGMALPYVLFAWFPGMAAAAAPSRSVARALQAGAGVSAVRDGDLARLGAGRAARQRCAAAPPDRAARRRLRALGVADRAHGGARPWGVAGLVVLAVAAIVAWPLFATEPDAVGEGGGRRQRGRRPRLDRVHAGHGVGAHRRRAARCSSTSPRRGASRAR